MSPIPLTSSSPSSSGSDRVHLGSFRIIGLQLAGRDIAHSTQYCTLVATVDKITEIIFGTVLTLSTVVLYFSCRGKEWPTRDKKKGPTGCIRPADPKTSLYERLAR